MATFCHVSVLLITAVVLSLVLEISSGDPSNPPDGNKKRIKPRKTQEIILGESGSLVFNGPPPTLPSKPKQRPMGNFGIPVGQNSNIYTLDVPDEPLLPTYFDDQDPYQRPLGNFGRISRGVGRNDYTLAVPDEPILPPNASHEHHGTFPTYVYPNQYGFEQDLPSGSGNYFREDFSQDYWDAVYGKNFGKQVMHNEDEDSEDQVERAEQREEYDTRLSLGTIYDNVQEHGNFQHDGKVEGSGVDKRSKVEGYGFDKSSNKKSRIDDDDDLDLKL